MRMTKCIHSLMIKCLMFLFGCIILSFSIFADDIKVYDYANLFTLDEIQKLEESITSLSNKYQMDIGIVTTEDVKGKTTQAYADDFYDENDYGVGENHDGILFLIDMENRVPHISTCGAGIKYFTDARITKILDTVYDYLADGNFYGAADSFLSQVQKYLDAGLETNQHTVETTPPQEPFKNEYGEPLNVQSVLLSIISALIGAFAIAFGVRLYISHRYSKPQYTSPATRPDDMSVQYTQREDRFVTSHTSRVKIQTNNGPSSNGGSSSSSGRSTTHTSSSGRSHGGGTGRKF